MNIKKNTYCQLLCSTDMLHQTTDFPKHMTYRQIGWMSFAVNLSDIAAMGGSPKGFLFSIGLPSSLTFSDVKEIAYGLNACSKFYSTPIIGGDTDKH